MKATGMNPTMIPSAMVHLDLEKYDTRNKIEEMLKYWGNTSQADFWKQTHRKIWSKSVRDACTMCGFCGEYICLGARQPKSGTLSTTLNELRNLREIAEIRPNSKVYEIVYDHRLRRATGVRYLDISNPDNPKEKFQQARNVILCAGAVQSARMLLMSGSPSGLGNKNGLVGKNALIHTF